METGDGAYFVVLIESWSRLKAALDRREALGESITITCPLVILFHSTSPNLTARHELFTALSVQYTQPPLTGRSYYCWVCSARFCLGSARQQKTTRREETSSRKLQCIVMRRLLVYHGSYVLKITLHQVFISIFT